MSSRRGFALLAALWLVVALATVAAGALAAARIGADTSRNRLVLRRAGWAREACVAILLAHYEADRPLRGVDSIDLGRDTWCRARVEEPASRLNLRLADGASLRRVLGSDSLVDALLDWQDADDVPRDHGAERSQYHAQGREPPRNAPLADVAELQLLLGFDRIPAESLDTWFTTRGAGPIDVNTASAPVVATLPGFNGSDVALLLELRRTGAHVASLDQLFARLGNARRDALAGSFSELAAEIVFQPLELTAQVEGAVGASPLRARATLTLIPTPERLALVRREIW